MMCLCLWHRARFPAICPFYLDGNTAEGEIPNRFTYALIKSHLDNPQIASASWTPRMNKKQFGVSRT